ncbi:MAG TPA: PRC-barrel domain-containing protein [Chthoniobacterales bacterium]|nr:PRC-barrel domain-containing protein [Chthoniobacterales bacterium]
MWQSLRQWYGEKLHASDGEIGHVRDFYFDDKNWAVRYLVADTGHWLTGRLVLISPHAVGHLDPAGKALLVNLTRKQIEGSPSIDEHKPVSRQHEEEFHRHYGYPYYAESSPLWGLAGYPVLVPPPAPAAARQAGVDSHLRSTRVVNGYSVALSDEVVGEVADFMMDGKTWIVRQLMVEGGHWSSGKKLLIPTEKVSRISYDESTVYVDSTREALLQAAEQSAAQAD